MKLAFLIFWACCFQFTTIVHAQSASHPPGETTNPSIENIKRGSIIPTISLGVSLLSLTVSIAAIVVSARNVRKGHKCAEFMDLIRGVEAQSDELIIKHRLNRTAIQKTQAERKAHQQEIYSQTQKVEAAFNKLKGLIPMKGRSDMEWSFAQWGKAIIADPYPVRDAQSVLTGGHPNLAKLDEDHAKWMDKLSSLRTDYLDHKL